MNDRPIVARSDHGKHHDDGNPDHFRYPKGWAMPSPHARPVHRHRRGCSPSIVRLAHIAHAGATAYLMHIALWTALVGVFVLGLQFDGAAPLAAAAASGGRGLLPSFFRRPAVLAEPAQPTRAPAVETTGVIKAVKAVADDTPIPFDEVDAHADDAIAMLRADLAAATRLAAGYRQQAEQAQRLADQTHRGAAAAIAGATRSAREAEQGCRVAVDLADRADRKARELQRVLDERLPAPDPEVLGARLIQVAARPLDQRLPTAEQLKVRRRNLGQAAIDSVRGLWPIQSLPVAEAEQNAPADGRLTPTEVAALDAIAAERLGGDPADAAKVGDNLGAGWLASGERRACAAPGAAGNGAAVVCTRTPHTRGQHVATGWGGHVLAAWPYETSPGSGVDAAASKAPVAPGAPAPGDPNPTREQRIERLARVLADSEQLGATWEKLGDAIRSDYMVLAAAADDAGWRAPLRNPAVDQRPVIAALLVNHEQLADGTCRCSWGHVACDALGCNEHPAWHAEHVAEQLVATGAIA